MIPVNPQEEFLEQRIEKEQKETPKVYSYEGMSPPKIKDLISFKQWVENASWANVISSNVQAIQYSEKWEVLSVMFIGGGLYEYRPVSMQIAREFFESPSIGKFLNNRIKKKYAVTQIK